MLQTYILKLPRDLIAVRKFCFGLLFFIGGICNAQDITESPTSTVKGAIQIEIASSYESFREGEEKNIGITFGSFLFLYGILDALELRLGMDFQQESTKRTGRKPIDVLSGYKPLQVGLGADVLNEKGIWPKMTVIGDVFIAATGGNDFEQNQFGFLIKSGFFHNLGKNKNAQLNYNLGAEFGNDNTAFVYSFAYLQNIKKLGGAYVEFSGDMANGQSANHFWNAGLYFTISPAFQFDTILGTGITADQDIYLTGRLQIYIQKKKKEKN